MNVLLGVIGNMNLDAFIVLKSYYLAFDRFRN